VVRRTAIRAQPFRPFHVQLTEGQRFPIDHPDCIAVSPRGQETVIDDDAGMSLIEILMVVRVRMTEPTEPREKS
jgi:hypothetical protein